MGGVDGFEDEVGSFNDDEGWNDDDILYSFYYSF